MAETTKPLKRAVTIPCRGIELQGELRLPSGASGVVIFAHGSGSSRHSPRNQAVGQFLRDHQLGTLLFDLLTEGEEEQERSTGHLRFDIPLLATRLAAAAEWLRTEYPELALGFFGSSTGAGAALVAAAQLTIPIQAVVSRGGRPDLAGPALAKVKSPTLLLVGGADTAVLQLNRAALAQMQCAKNLQVIPGATHLFEEPGALEQVSALAADWFRQHLTSSGGGVFTL